MTNTSASRRISSAMASRNASRTVMVTISTSAGTSVSSVATGRGGAANACTTLVSVPASGPFVSRALSAFGATEAAPGPFNALVSSPSDRITAIGVFTATSAVPSGTRIFPNVPSSVASTSMVALSVSISAMMSPDRMRSPTPFIHLARLPFSMGGEFGRLVNDPAHFRVGPLELVLVRPIGCKQAHAHLLDRIALGADLFDLLAAAVFCWIRHGVTAIAVGHHLQNDGALAVAAPLYGLFAGR